MNSINGSIIDSVLANSQVIGVSLMAVAVACTFLVVIRVGSDMFAIYRNNFVSTVDRGFRDVLIFLDPKQVVTVTIVATLIVVPILFLTLGWVVAIVAVIFLVVAPGFILRRLKEKRSDKFVALLPDALMSLSASLRAGLNIVKGLNQIVKNQPDPIASEFAQVLVEYRVGQDLNESLAALAERIDREELILMNSGIKVSREVGGNLSDTLEVLANTLRSKAEAQGKVKAMTSMGRAQAVVAVALPLLVGVLFAFAEPTTMAKLFSTTLGLIWLGIMTAMMILALFFIKQIVKVDV